MDNGDYQFDPNLVEKSVDDTFTKSYEEIEQSLKQRLTIAFLGTGSSGKTSAIKALFDIDLGDISPIAGSTKDVKVIPVSKNVYIVDAPGFGDIKKEVSDKAKQICDDTDIFIYILNAEGGYKEQEKNDYEQLKSFGKDVLVVVNKIDLIRKDDLNDFVQDLKEKMGVEDENLILAAFNPLPQISEEPINVDKVMDWINTKIETKGKELLLAKIMKGKDALVDKWIWRASIAAAAIGLLPIPGSDIVPLTTLQIALILKIAHVYGYDISKEKAKALIIATLSGQAGRTVFRQLAKLIPVIGSAVGAVIAGAFTYAIGMAMKKYFKSGMSIPIEELGKIGIEYTKEAMKYKDEFKKAKNNKNNKNKQ